MDAQEKELRQHSEIVGRMEFRFAGVRCAAECLEVILVAGDPLRFDAGAQLAVFREHHPLQRLARGQSGTGEEGAPEWAVTFQAADHRCLGICGKFVNLLQKIPRSSRWVDANSSAGVRTRRLRAAIHWRRSFTGHFAGSGRLRITSKAALSKPQPTTTPSEKFDERSKLPASSSVSKSRPSVVRSPNVAAAWADAPNNSLTGVSLVVHATDASSSLNDLVPDASRHPGRRTASPKASSS